MKNRARTIAICFSLVAIMFGLPGIVLYTIAANDTTNVTATIGHVGNKKVRTGESMEVWYRSLDQRDIPDGELLAIMAGIHVEPVAEFSIIRSSGIQHQGKIQWKKLCDISSKGDGIIVVNVSNPSIEVRVSKSIEAFAIIGIVMSVFISSMCFVLLVMFVWNALSRSATGEQTSSGTR